MPVSLTIGSASSGTQLRGNHTLSGTFGSLIFQRLHRVCDGAGSVSDIVLWLGVFCYVLTGGLALQFLIIPLWFPGAHAGEGLIVGSDWLAFHQIARVQAAFIEQEGWSAWALRPEGQAPAGVASAMYVLIAPTPAAMLPVNAILFATAILAARSILTVFFQHRGIATLATAPFVFFPSFIIVWGQIHKDVFVGAGLLLLMKALVFCIVKERYLLKGVLLSAAGALLIWVARGHALEIAVGAMAAFAGVLVFFCPRRLLRLVPIVLVVLLITFLGRGSGQLTSWAGSERVATYAPAVEAPLSPVPDDPATFAGWNRCAPLPSTTLDRVLFSFCTYRVGYLMEFPDAGSNTDAHVQLRTVEDFVLYTPRALHLAILEPTPFLSLARQSEIGSIGRIFVSVEMLYSYMVFALGIILGWRRLIENPIILALIAFILTFILVHVFAIPNAGTVYRMRIFAFTFMVCIATAMAIFPILIGRLQKRSDMERHNSK